MRLFSNPTTQRKYERICGDIMTFLLFGAAALGVIFLVGCGCEALAAWLDKLATCLMEWMS